MQRKWSKAWQMKLFLLWNALSQYPRWVTCSNLDLISFYLKKKRLQPILFYSQIFSLVDWITKKLISLRNPAEVKTPSPGLGAPEGHDGCFLEGSLLSFRRPIRWRPRLATPDGGVRGRHHSPARPCVTVTTSAWCQQRGRRSLR